jgi:hypothetical protein
MAYTVTLLASSALKRAGFASTVTTLRGGGVPQPVSSVAQAKVHMTKIKHANLTPAGQCRPEGPGRK